MFILRLVLAALIVITSAKLSASYDLPVAKNIGVDQGLRQPQILDFEQDNQGYIWLATQAGMFRYNGESFLEMTAGIDPKTSLPANYVNRLHFDKLTNTLYIATINGLTKLNLNTSKLTMIPLADKGKSISHNVLSVTLDASQNLWIGTASGIYLLKPEESEAQMVDLGEYLSINDIYTKHDTSIVLATSKGVFVIDKTTYKASKLTDFPDHVHRIISDYAGNLWMGQFKGGVYQYKAKSLQRPELLKHYTDANGLINNEVNDLLLRSDNTVWVATPLGVSVISATTQEVVATHRNVVSLGQRSRISHDITLFESANKHILIGSRDSGFSILDSGSNIFMNWQFGDSIAVEYIARISNDEFFVTTSSGVFKVNSEGEILGNWNFDETDLKTIGNNSIGGIEYLPTTKAIWLASRSGLAVLEPEAEHIKLKRFEGTKVYSVNKSHDNLLWVGGYEAGLYLYDTQADKILKHWPMPLVTHILDLGPEETWVTTIGGLYYIDRTNDSIIHYQHDPQSKQGLPIDALSWVSEHNQGEYYLGTLGRGVWIMKQGENKSDVTFESLSEDELLTGVSVGAVVDGNDGNIWITTQHGILKYDNDSQRVYSFDGNNGASDSGYFVSAIEQDSTGNLFFAGFDGLTVFNPKALTLDNYMPNVHIEKVSIKQRTQGDLAAPKSKSYNSFNMPDVIVLSPQDLILDISFVALEYADRDNVRFAYRIPEIDPAWQYLDAGKHSASFMNLEPSNYTFEIKVRNRYYEWSESKAYLSIVALPHWWQTNVARLLFVFLFLLIVVILYKWRTYRYRALASSLELQVAEQTKELKATNTRFRKLSMYDSLTEVLNRRGFTQWANNEKAKYKRSNQPYSILLLDIDNFKRVNDKFGHVSGDTALIHIAKTLKKTLRAQDIMARWGGEEFIILLPETSIHAAKSVAEKLRLAVEKTPLQLNSNSITCTITLGVACIKDFVEFDDCVSHADMLLYKGKQQGRNRVVAEPPTK